MRGVWLDLDASTGRHDGAYIDVAAAFALADRTSIGAGVLEVGRVRSHDTFVVGAGAALDPLAVADETELGAAK